MSTEKSMNSSPLQTAASQTTTTITSRSDEHPEHNYTEPTEPRAPDPTVHKTPESNHQVQPDSVPSTGGREDSNYVHLFVHQTRVQGSSIQRDSKIRIKFPKAANAKTWKELDQHLGVAVSRRFTLSTLKRRDINKLIEEFDEFIYGFFLEQCGAEDDSPPSKTPTNVSKVHRGLERLRQKKNDCKKALKALKNAGLADSTTAASMKKLWFKLIQRHNKLRCRVTKQRTQKRRVQAERQFKRDPNRYAGNLFKGESLNGTPSFSQKEAETYFQNLYHDEERSQTYAPLEGMERPPAPEFPFFDQEPTHRELKKHMRNKRNLACPGLNSIPYLVYKKCPSLRKTILAIFRRIFKEKVIPNDWAIAFVVLLQKCPEVLDKPSEFRPIAITNTLGKIFFSIISARLQKYLIKNGYIQTPIQKGFLFGVPGCVEHSFTLWEALREAKDEARAIVISWLDLANAYGSVRHNLIQFALNWYHVPEIIQQLIFDYYEKQCAKVTSKNWSTDFFPFLIGLFQGCVLSTILFDCVFNLLLDFLNPLRDKGYRFKAADVSIMHKAYADDLQFTTRTTEGHQLALNRTQSWLNWTKTMKAKPKKCVSFAMKQFRDWPNVKSQKGHTPVSNTTYSPFDPKLEIAGQPLHFLLETNKNHAFMAGHFKFLGKWMSADLSEQAVKAMFKTSFFKWMDMVDKDHVNGLMKLWLYQHQIIAKTAWPLMIQDFNRDFAVKTIQQPTNVYLRQWAGLFKGAEMGTLYRPRKLLGLDLTSITTHFERMRVIRCHLLKHSADQDVVTIYNIRAERQKSHKKIWRDTQLLAKVESMVAHETKFQAAEPHDKRGLGHELFVTGLDNNAAHRKGCISAVQKLATERLSAHSSKLARQSVWSHWTDHSTAFDLSWNNLIWGPGPRIISFVLNAAINSLPTPDMLFLMSISKEESCSLCGAKKCTLFHVLVNCKKALTDKRYTWRHDSILATLLQLLVPVLMRHNASKPVSSKPAPIAFVKEKSQNVVEKNPNRNHPSPRNLLKSANDWQLLIDFDHCRMIFPPIIVATDKRPDVVIWSTSTKTVLLIELTCPAEENFANAHAYKMDRYASLVEQIRNAGWSVHCRTIEAGARGFVSHRFRKTLRELSFTSLEASRACKDISLVAAKCSYAIWLGRKSANWNVSMELVVPPRYLFPAPTTTPAPLLRSRRTGENQNWHLRPELSSGAIPASESMLAASAAITATNAASIALSAAAEAVSYARDAAAAASTTQAASERASAAFTATLKLRPASYPRASLALRSKRTPRKRKRKRKMTKTAFHPTLFEVPENSVPMWCNILS